MHLLQYSIELFHGIEYSELVQLNYSDISLGSREKMSGSFFKYLPDFVSQ